MACNAFRHRRRRISSARSSRLPERSICPLVGTARGRAAWDAGLNGRSPEDATLDAALASAGPRGLEPGHGAFFPAAVPDVTPGARGRAAH